MRTNTHILPAPSTRKTTTLVLDTSDIHHIIQAIGLDELMDRMIAGLTCALQNFDSNTNQQVSREGFQYFKPDFGLVEWMPFHSDNGVTLKTVGYHPSNPQKHNLPTILSTLSTYDTHTGHLLGLTDATFLTALRTGAASAITSQILASPHSVHVGLIGCGAQAVTQLHALSRIFPINKVWLFDTEVETAHSFCQRASFLDVDYRVMDKKQLAELVSHVDILCTCTSELPGNNPVFNPTVYQPHLHINAVGADFPGKTELPLTILQQSTVIPDFLPQALKEGECQQLDRSQIDMDLVDLVQQANDVAYLRHQLTVFDSTGWALEDDVAIHLFMNIAKELKIGTEIQLECFSDDPKNPYPFFN